MDFGARREERFLPFTFQPPPPVVRVGFQEGLRGRGGTSGDARRLACGMMITEIA